MFDKPFHLTIVAPDRVAFEGEAVSVSLPGVLGMFQVLYNHAPLLAELVPGSMKIKQGSGTDSVFAVGGGFAEVRDNQVTVLADSVEPPPDIDVERARRAAERAGEIIRTRAQGGEREEAIIALRRAQNRLKVAGTR